jgi:hypothetical protein
MGGETFPIVGIHQPIDQTPILAMSECARMGRAESISEPVPPIRYYKLTLQYITALGEATTFDIWVEGGITDHSS